MTEEEARPNDRERKRGARVPWWWLVVVAAVFSVVIAALIVLGPIVRDMRVAIEVDELLDAGQPEAVVARLQHSALRGRSPLAAVSYVHALTQLGEPERAFETARLLPELCANSVLPIDEAGVLEVVVLTGIAARSADVGEFAAELARLDPSSSAGHWGLGFVGEKCGDLVSAETHYRRAAALSQPTGLARRALPWFLVRTQGADRSHPDVQAYLALDVPDFGLLDADRGLFAAREGDLDSAVRHLDRAVATTAGHGAPLWIMLARVHRRRGDRVGFDAALRAAELAARSEYAAGTIERERQAFGRPDAHERVHADLLPGEVDPARHWFRFAGFDEVPIDWLRPPASPR